MQVDLTLQREPVVKLWPEVHPLLVAHWREISHYDDIPLDVDTETYETLDNLGVLRCYTARVAGVLVGYSAFMVRQNIHYRGSKQAVQDVLFVTKEYRRSRIGLNLLAYADEQLKADGVQVVYHHSKLAHDIGPVLGRIGYEPIETIYGRRLDR